nr:hypothetical protein [Mycoplasmopsis bovis]
MNLNILIKSSYILQFWPDGNISISKVKNIIANTIHLYCNAKGLKAKKDTKKEINITMKNSITSFQEKTLVILIFLYFNPIGL